MATGLASTIALGLVFVAGIGPGVLAYSVRTDSGLLGIVDSSVAERGASHATAWSTEDALETLTHWATRSPWSSSPSSL